MSVQEAMNYTAQLVQQSYSAIQDLEPKLRYLGLENNIDGEVQKFIRGCKDFAIGTVNWG
jgi:hypothetical protein